MAEQPPAGQETPLGGVHDAIQGLRREMHQRLQRSSEELLQLVERFAFEVPEPQAPTKDPEAGPSLAALRDAVANIDRANSQSEVLARLLEQSAAFASRTALFLVAEDDSGALDGWATIGFDPSGASLEGARLSPDPQTPWTEVGTGRGTHRLTAGDCALLCSRIEAPLPRQGVLVPLVLRDRVSAVLYADRTGAADTFSVDALQMLTYSAAQALEVVPLRSQHSTGTLTVVDTPVVEPAIPEPALSETGAWEQEIDEEPVLAQEPEGHDVVTGSFAAVEPAQASITAEVTPREVESPPPPVSDLVADPLIEAPAPDSPVGEFLEPAALDSAEATDLLPEAERRAGFVVEELPDLVDDPSTEPAIEAPAWSLDEAPSDVFGPAAATPEPDVDAVQFDLIEREAADSSLSTGEVLAPVEAAQAEAWELDTSAAQVEPPLQAPSEEIATPMVGVPPSAAPVQQPAGPSLVDSFLPEAETPPLRAKGSVLEEMQTQAALESTESVESATLETQLISQRPPTLEPAAAIAPAADAPVASGEVVPPSDIEGPGLAFLSDAETPATGDEPLHEEARRLARLLVSEIKLYNEEQIEEGRRVGNIYEQLREDIDRSRQMYEERIDERVRVSSDYFRDELVRSLAGGDANVMGL